MSISLKEFVTKPEQKLFIGTANFNGKYGVQRRASIFDRKDLSKIFLEVESIHNIFLDTAQAYFGVEKLIGNIAGKKLNNKVVTKINPHKFDTSKSIVKLVEKSLTDLNQSCLYGVLLHNTNILESPNIDDIVQGLEYCLDSGIVSHIGLSSYESSAIQLAAAKYDTFTLFQLNENIVDQRNFHSKELSALKELNKEIFVRSIFLQGNLLVTDSEIIESLMPKREVFIAFKEFCRKHNSSPLKICLDYAKSITWSNGIIVGVTSFENYLEIIESYINPINVSNFLTPTLGNFYSDPRNWIDS